MKTLYFDCFSGISGDMFLGAMVDIGVDKQHIINELTKLNFEGWNVEFTKAGKMGIFGTRAHVTDLTQTSQGTGFALPGNIPIKQQAHKHKHHEGLGFSDIKKLIEDSNLNENCKKLSIKIFKIIGEAEAKIHNKSLDDIHFHEVGAIDSIVDIVGASICIDYLKPDRIMASRVELGGGFVKCAHGTFPVPAPATAEILKGIPVKTGTVQSETTTPTGAAILASIVDEFTDNLNFTIEKTGYGIGFKDFNIPNVLRVYWGQTDNTLQDKAIMVECNIDDMNPEIYQYVLEKLFEKGALDVFLTPIIMKKSRPAIKLSAICTPDTSENIINTILHETSTLGVRQYEVNRTILNRETITIETKYGKVRVKKSFNQQTEKYKPEFDDCAQLATKLNVPITDIMNEAMKLINKV